MFKKKLCVYLYLNEYRYTQRTANKISGVKCSNTGVTVLILFLHNLENLNLCSNKRISSSRGCDLFRDTEKVNSETLSTEGPQVTSHHLFIYIFLRLKCQVWGETSWAS